jgi:hypothetical protein
MNLLSVNKEASLTDALERDLLLSSTDEQSNVKVGESIKRAAMAVISVTRTFFAFMDEVDETMHRAREQSARYTGSHW